MGDKAKALLTKLELKLMQVIWQRGPSTVSEVRDALGDGPAYTTVQTMLNILERKGHLRRRLKGRAFEYRAATSANRAAGKAVLELIDRMFGGSPEELVMSLIQQKHIDLERLEDLRRRLEERQRLGKGGQG